MHNLFQLVLRSSYQNLPEVVRHCHEARLGHFEGEVEVSGSMGLLARLLRRLAGLPGPAARSAAVIKVLRSEVRERLLRQFGAAAFSTSLSRVHKQNLLREDYGLFTFFFTLSVREQQLRWQCVGWSMAGIPLPDSLAPDVDAYEATDASGRLLFKMAIEMPGVGLLLGYEGWLTVVTARTVAAD